MPHAVSFWFAGLTWHVLAQMSLAVVLGGIIGVERELRGRPAGLRTMALVCLGSALVMILSNHLNNDLPTATTGLPWRVDRGRTIAGVVTGIGFLGGGVILRLSDVIRGVTTAAAIWFVAALGVVIGEGQLGLGLVAALFALTVLWFFQYLERPLHGQIYPTLHLVISTEHAQSALEATRILLREQHIRLMDLKAATDNAAAVTELHLFVRTQQHFQAPQVVSAIAMIEGVQHARWR